MAINGTFRKDFFILLLFVFSAAIIGDNIAESLFLSNFSSESIPRVYIINAFSLLIFSLPFISYVDRVDRGNLFVFTIAIHFFIVAILALLAFVKVSLMAAVIYPYSYLSKMFTFIIFWTLANDITDSRKAAGDFPFVAAGGTIGAVLISFIIPQFVNHFSVNYLFVLWLILIGSIVSFFVLRKHIYEQSFIPTVTSLNKIGGNVTIPIYSDVKFVVSNSLLLNMAILYFLLFFLLLNQQYYFYSSIKIKFISPERLSSFLGLFNTVAMTLTFFSQVFISTRIMKFFGSTRTMFVLPTLFFIIFGFFYYASAEMSLNNFIVSFLWMVVCSTALRIIVFDSFFSPDFQVFFSSLPHEMRGRGKFAINGIVKPVSMVFSAFWIMFAVAHISLNTNLLILLIISFLTIIQTIRVKYDYTRTLSSYLGNGLKGDKIPKFNGNFLKNYDSIKKISRTLVNEPIPIKLYIITLLSQLKSKNAIRILIDYFGKSDSKDAKKLIIQSMNHHYRDIVIPFLESNINSSDTDVASEVVLKLSEFKNVNMSIFIKPFLQDTSISNRLIAIVTLYETISPSEKLELEDEFEKILFSDNVSDSIKALRILNRKKTKGLIKLIDFFFSKREGIIKSNRALWTEFLKVARFSDSDFLLKEILNASEEKCKRRDIIKYLRDIILSGFPVENLIERFLKQNIYARYCILKSIELSHIPISKSIKERLVLTAFSEFEHLQVEHEHSRLMEFFSTYESIKLLASAVTEELVNVYIENLISISSILDKSRQIEVVKSRLMHKNDHIRAGAIEVLDNVGNQRINKLVVYALEEDYRLPYNSDGDDVSLLADVISNYSKNSVDWVMQCANYVNLKMDLF